jgi:AcrR family transcriptional regulator
MHSQDRAILDAADRLFYARGINAVGMLEVRDAAGVSLRRLYAEHPSKRDLVVSWLEDRHTRWMRWFDAAVERRVAAGVVPLLATFDAIEEWVGSDGYRGCAFINAIAETTASDDVVSAIVTRHKGELLERLVALASASLTGSAPPSWLPDAMAVLIDGSIVQCAIRADPSPVHAARTAATALLELLS